MVFSLSVLMFLTDVVKYMNISKIRRMIPKARRAIPKGRTDDISATPAPARINETMINAMNRPFLVFFFS